MSTLPTGTVTFLFTDIEGSTTLWEQHPAAARTALVRHDALVEQVVTEHDGHLVRPRGEGDSRFAVFARATDAVAAAATLQVVLHAEPWPTPTPLRVRMALHTGEADLRDGDYYGSAVNRCARLRAVAHGGQTLLSAVTQELVRDALPAGGTLHDLGEQRLKDLTRPEYVFQLTPAGLPNDFPALKTLDRVPNNLPLQPTALIGREREVQAVRQRLLLPEGRLITLTGPGGTGKTRLALQVAADMLDDVEDGVWFVDLVPIRDPALVASAVANVLGVPEAGSRLLDRLKAYVHTRHMLLVLDNFEQLLPAAPLVAALLQAAPRLCVLVTSRAPLHLRGEREFPVPPLSLPDPLHLPSPHRLRQYDAVALFIDRAQDVKPGFAITNATAPAVAEICARLDGLPLAIELAAARVKVLPPGALLARLEHRLRVLTGGARDLETRQQTLRGTIDWSYHLLTSEDQTVFERLGVFVGGCTLEAVEAICPIENPPSDNIDILDVITSLVDKSLVRQAEGSDGEPRFTMLETIHEYARERLDVRGTAQALRRQHATYYLELAEAAEPELRGVNQTAWLDQLQTEQGNFRSALTSITDKQHEGYVRNASPGEDLIEIGLRLVGALWRFWWLRGFYEEQLRWFDAMVALAGWDTAARSGIQAHFHSIAGSPRPRTVALAKVLLAGATLAVANRDSNGAVALGRASLALYRELGDPVSSVAALAVVGEAEARRGEVASGLALLEESLALARQLSGRALTGELLESVGYAALAQFDYRRATTLFTESLALNRQTGDQWGCARSLLGQATVAWAKGNYAAVRALNEERLSIEQALSNTSGVSHSLCALGEAAWALGDYAQAKTFFEQSLALGRSLGYSGLIYDAISGLGEVEYAQGDVKRAERYWRETLDPDGGPWNRQTLLVLAMAARKQQDDRQAQKLVAESLLHYQNLRDQPGIIACFMEMAAVAGVRRQWMRATRLSGAADAHLSRIGLVVPPPRRADYDRCFVAARNELDDAAFEAAWAEGQAMTLEQAVAYAREEVPDG